MPTLYVVATPIGNLEDVTLRALRVLREVGLIAAEDTRTTRKLLNRHEIRTPLISYNEHNREKRIPHLLDRLREVDVALVSEAGTPGIRDPGRELVIAAVQQGVPVVSVPGPSAVATALAVSGLPADQFLFLGYLVLRASFDDRDKADRVSAILAAVGAINVPIIHYSVEWWSTLHQGPTIARLDSPSITPDMLVPLLIMIVGFTVYFAWVAIVRLQGEVLERERSARWVQQLAAGGAE